MEDLFESQKASFGIQDFLNSAKTYTIDTFPDLDLNNFFNSMIFRKSRF